MSKVFNLGGVVVVLCVVSMFISTMNGCAITTPKGVYSLELSGENVGFVKDVVAQLGSLYQELEQQETELELAQKQGKVDRIESLLSKIDSLKTKIEKKEATVVEKITEAQKVVDAN